MIIPRALVALQDFIFSNKECATLNSGADLTSRVPVCRLPSPCPLSHTFSENEPENNRERDIYQPQFDVQLTNTTVEILFRLSISLSFDLVSIGKRLCPSVFASSCSVL
ncbi:hypothetical protein SDJN02_21570, partial [Cucurbita argyrosperma subsp. argyrosperma]